ncbi:MAG: hypothetical protein H6581_30485 [Bacteroidia bacterium]|nr:hypothetical protein [Bacteroidia bacterium]
MDIQLMMRGRLWSELKRGSSSEPSHLIKYIMFEPNFDQAIEKRMNVLDDRKNKLEMLKGSLKFSEPIQFSVAELPEKVNVRKKGEKWNCDVLGVSPKSCKF